jgi:hypothetical protein
MTTSYWEFWDGLALLRAAESDTEAGFRLMSTGTKGQWVDDVALGLRRYSTDARRIYEADAAKIAARLGGTLRDDGGLVAMNKDGSQRQR